MPAHAGVLTIEELAEYLKIPKSTLYKLAQEGKLPGQKVGRRWRFLREAVDRWLEEAGGSRAVVAELLTRDPALAEIVRRLVEAYRPQRIYLFGSKARGDAGPDSDYDLLVIVPDDAPPERRSSRLAYERLWGVGTAADVLIWTKTGFDSRAHLAAALPATVLRDGRLLYAA